ncbi:bifunctional protein-disulfide isomerase/oxidoreductase DsbC [Candidatus Profftia tarda]|nr:bifunctional protein-disulfide isomerase/oxidoreductase DsbC [Candidatus Profftia tarda]
MQHYLMYLGLLAALVANTAQANDRKIQRSLKAIGVQQAETQSSPIAELQTVFTEKGIMYITRDGKYIMQGPIYDLSNKVPINVTNQMLVINRLQQLVPEMLIYKASQEKYIITVFMDINCKYCRKLHSQIKKYNDLGITVRYLAFPREGLSSQTEKDIQSIWCIKDCRRTPHKAQSGNRINPVTCNINIKKHYELGVQFGVQGTPAIILNNGTVIPGYRRPTEMLAILEDDNAK